MSLVIVPPAYVYQAWEKEGADCLSEVCDLVDEITPSQLKMLLARGERYLVRIDDEGKAVGWGAFRVDNLPNLRVLHITDLVAHNAGFERFFGEIKEVAAKMGCSRVRSSCHPAQARLYKMKCGFRPVYETIEVDV